MILIATVFTKWQCYAWINASSGLLQFAVLPFLVKRIDARRLWLVLPCTMLLFATLMSYQHETTLYFIAATFSVYKALEYSVRGVTVEMVRDLGSNQCVSCLALVSNTISYRSMYRWIMKVVSWEKESLGSL
jgi:hypothetical protein